MARWGRISLVFAAALAFGAPSAQAASPYARAVLVSCDKETREAVFQGRVVSLRQAAKMQLRFTLQASTPENKPWRRIDAPGFGQWITAPAGLGKYTYDKTVEGLLPPANYRAVVNFRWRNARGRVVRSEQAISPVCRQPDDRPDLLVRDLSIEPGGHYVAVIFNRGRQPAGPFSVDFLRDGAPLGTAEVAGLAPREAFTVVLPAMPCSPWERIEAVADARSQVDESDEENDALGVFC